MKTRACIEYINDKLRVRVDITNIEKFDAETICFLQVLAAEIENAQTIRGGLIWEEADDTSVQLTAELAEWYDEETLVGIREQLNLAICSCFSELPKRILPHPNPESLM